MSNYKLVICEKYNAAKRIASALGRYSTKKVNHINIFIVKDYIILYASGHLYNLATNKRSYPVFDPLWQPRPSAYRMINVIRTMAENARYFINACDFDQEGEVIAYNILTFACNDAYNRSYRAKFSALTKGQIIEAFSNLEPSSKFKGLADAGITRHTLDFIYGINLSRALTDASKKILSIGRVQGPTLAFIIDREVEIQLHIPKPYWIIESLLAKDDKEFTARYESIIYNEQEAREILNRCKDRDGRVVDVEVEQIRLKPPTPFNLTDLQQEAYKYLRLSPSRTLSIAEKLYLNALISYPRTSSQKLPKMNYKAIIDNLSHIKAYRDTSLELLKKRRLMPNNGVKDDPAHPAIYPTGELPQGLNKLEYKVYDLIVRRFLVTFMDPAIINKVHVSVDINGYIFNAEGRSIEEESWLKVYGSYTEIDLPDLKVNDIVRNLRIDSLEKFTKPKPRFNASSLLALMEREKIGTKSTRSMIIDTLIKRGYVTNKFEPTPLGFTVFEVIREYMPDILSVSLTRDMEEKLEKVEEGLLKPSIVIGEASEQLIKVLNKFIEKKRIISNKLRTILNNEV